jgi:nucleoside-diphosphate-sugar epimerase
MDKGHRPGYTYTEKDWNPVTYDVAANKDTDGGVAYCASKTFAEQAAYDYVENNKPIFAVSSICPPMVYGPALHTIASLDHLNTSSADIYRLMNGSEKAVPEGNPGAEFPDVYKVDNSKIKTELGMEFRDLQTCIHDQMAEFIAVEKRTKNA